MSRYILRKWDQGLKLKEYIAVFDFEGIQGEFRLRVLDGLACLQIPFPTVPRTDDFALFDCALPERSAPVQADVVDRGVSSVHIGNANFLVATAKFLGLVSAGEV